MRCFCAPGYGGSGIGPFGCQPGGQQIPGPLPPTPEVNIYHILIECVSYFSKGTFPRKTSQMNFPSGNLKNLQFFMRQLPKDQVRPSEAAMGSTAAARMGKGADH